MGIKTAIWEKWIEFKYEWLKITAAAMVSPLLYMIALGWGIGNMASMGGRSYIDFLVPGIIAMSTMNTSFSAVSTPLNIQRIFEHSFEQIIISPTSLGQYVIGQTIGGAKRYLQWCAGAADFYSVRRRIEANPNVFSDNAFKRHGLRSAGCICGSNRQFAYRRQQVFDLYNHANDLSMQHLLSAR